MKDQLTLLGLSPVFAALGALATAAAWQGFALTMLGFVPATMTVLAYLVAGLAGPVAVWAMLWLVTRHRHCGLAPTVRRAGSLGLGLVLAAELGFYIPLGFFATAF